MEELYSKNLRFMKYEGDDEIEINVRIAIEDEEIRDLIERKSEAFFKEISDLFSKRKVIQKS